MDATREFVQHLDGDVAALVEAIVGEFPPDTVDGWDAIAGEARMRAQAGIMRLLDSVGAAVDELAEGGDLPPIAATFARAGLEAVDVPRAARAVAWMARDEWAARAAREG